MKKSIKSLFLAVLVLLILGGGYFLAVKWEGAPNEEDETLPENTIQYVLNEEIENIEYAQFNNEGKSYIIRNGEKASIEGYESYIIDEDALFYALYDVCSVEISHKIESKDFALSDFGLDKEDRSLVLKLKDGTQKKLVIGNSANFEGEYYARLNDTIFPAPISDGGMGRGRGRRVHTAQYPQDMQATRPTARSSHTGDRRAWGCSPARG